MTLKWGCRSGGKSVRLLSCFQKLVMMISDMLHYGNYWSFTTLSILIKG